MTAASKKHLCRKQEELPSKSEENVTTTEQNTKQEWEEKILIEFCKALPGTVTIRNQFGGTNKQMKLSNTEIEILINAVKQALASQRHQLKEQVLEAVGELEEVDIITEDGDEDVDYDGYLRNEFKEELIERIEAVFEGKEV